MTQTTTTTTNETFTLDLTRGNVKAAMAQAGATSADLWRVPPSMIRLILGFNPRVDNDEYRQHKLNIENSIIANGYYQDEPLGGFVAEVDGQNVIYLTKGHTRFAGVLGAIAKGTPIDLVPIVIKAKGTNMKDLTTSLVVSNTGKGFTPFETGLICKRLIGYGDTPSEVAAKFSMDVGYVNDLLGLVGAPQAIVDMVVSGQAAATLAINELSKSGSKAAGRLQAGLEVAKAEGKTRVTNKHLEKPVKPNLKLLLSQCLVILEPLSIHSALTSEIRAAVG